MADLPQIVKAQRAEEHLKVDQRLMQLLESYHSIILQDDNFPEKLAWCLEHCQTKFRDLTHAKGRIWYFQSEQDASMFALKWS